MSSRCRCLPACKHVHRKIEWKMKVTYVCIGKRNQQAKMVLLTRQMAAVRQLYAQVGCERGQCVNANQGTELNKA